MSYQSDRAHDLPDQHEEEPGLEDVPAGRTPRAGAANVSHGDSHTPKAAAAMLAAALAGVGGVRIIPNARVLERSCAWRANQ